jgi:2-hydroxychromene-2-carboxylate isomerase
MRGMKTALWYFDFISPFAYLQWQRLKPLRAQLALEPRPILFAALLDHWGQKGPAEIPAKRTFTYQFVSWRARRDGVPLRFPPAHPFNPLAALRLCLAAGASDASIEVIFDWIWARGNAGDSAAALAEPARALGIADVATAIAAPEVKARLRANTESAIASNVFGVPTTLVDGRAFWGDDATPMLAEYLAGRDPFAGDEMRRLETIPQAASRIA